jgi:hypothetical protein
MYEAFLFLFSFCIIDVLSLFFIAMYFLLMLHLLFLLKIFTFLCSYLSNTSVSVLHSSLTLLSSCVLFIISFTLLWTVLDHARMKVIVTLLKIICLSKAPLRRAVTGFYVVSVA